MSSMPARGPHVAAEAPPDGGGGLAVVLFRPLIPTNTGNIARTCVATNTPLYLVRPFAFSLDESRLRRAGLDYWHDLRLGLLDDLAPLAGGGRVVAVSRRGTTSMPDFEFLPTDRLLFGPEDVGLPDEVLDAHPSVSIPMSGRVRSLNLANSVAITLFTALDRLGRPGGPGDPTAPREEARG